MKPKRYWLRLGLPVFVLSLALNIYITFVLFTNVMRVYQTGQPQPFDIRDYIHLMPGFGLLKMAAYGGIEGLFIGSVILAVLYGIVAAIVGGIWGMLMKKSDNIQL